MKKFAVFLLSALPAFAAGTVNQVSQQLGTSTTWALTMSWVGDPVTGSVPLTAAKLPPEIGFGQGYRIVSAETAPGAVAPTSNYNVMLTDSVGLDLLGGAAIGLSATAAQTFNGNSSAPIYGAFSLLITGNSMASAAGKIIVYISPISSIVLSPGQIPPPVTPGLIPDTIIAGGSLAAQCAHAQGVNAKYQLALTKNWINVPTQTIPCTIYPAGGSITAGTGQVVTYGGAPILTRQQVFSCGSQYGSIIMANGHGTPELVGAFGNDSLGPTISSDAAPGLECALHMFPPTGGTLDMSAGLTYYLKSAQGGQGSVAITDAALYKSFTLEGNGAILDSTALGANTTVLTSSPNTTYGSLPALMSFADACTAACTPMSSVARGDYTIAVSSSTQFHIGDAIYLTGGLGAGSEPNAELNQVAAVPDSTHVQLLWASSKPYITGGGNASQAVDVEAETVRNYTIKDLTLNGNQNDGPVVGIQCMGCQYLNVSLNSPGVSWINGSNRNTLFDGWNVIGSGANFYQFQVALNDINTTVLNATFTNTSSTAVYGIGQFEGSCNTIFDNLTTWGLVQTVVDSPAVGTMFDFSLLNSTIHWYGSLAGAFAFQTNGGGAQPVPGIVVNNVKFLNTSTNMATVSAGAPRMIFTNNLLSSPNLTSGVPNSFAGDVGEVVSNNTVITGSHGLLFQSGTADPIIANNSIYGPSGTPSANTTCIQDSPGTTQAIGPNIFGNSCSNFDQGIFTNGNVNLYPNRSVGYNSFSNVNTHYNAAGLAVMEPMGATNSFVSFGGIPYNSAFDPGVGVKKLYVAQTGSQFGGTFAVTDDVALDCGNQFGCSMAIGTHDDGTTSAQAFFNFQHTTSGFSGFIGHQVIAGVPTFSFNPGGSGSLNNSFTAHSLTLGSLVGATGSGGHPVCAVPASGLAYIATNPTGPC